MRRFRVKSDAHVKVVAYDSAGDRIYALAQNKGEPHAHAWALSTGKEVQGDRFPRVADTFTVARRADAIAAGREGRFHVFSRRGDSHRLVQFVTARVEIVAAISDEGNVLAMSRGVIPNVGDMQSRINVQRLDTPSDRMEFHSMNLTCDVDFSPDGNLLVTSGVGGFTIWDLRREE